MSALIAWDDTGAWREVWICAPDIHRVLRAEGVTYGRWDLRELGGAADVVTALDRYDAPLRALGLPVPSDDGRTVARTACAWRRHAGRRSGTWRDERSGFVLMLEGAALLHLRARGTHLGLVCEAGDWVMLSDGMDSRIDGGSDPDFDLLTLCLPATSRRSVMDADGPGMDEVVAELAERIGFGAESSLQSCARD